MELLLWLWLYDNRFFFSVKIPIVFYQLTWLLSILINAFICSVGGYYIITKDIITSLMRMLLMSNMALCGITLLISIGFVIRISYEHKTYVNNYSEAVKTIPELSIVINSNDYWVRSQSLNSIFGVGLLLCSLIEFVFAMGLMVFRKEWMIIQSYSLNEQNLIFYYAAYVLVFTIPVFAEFMLSIVIKVGAFVSVYICPQLYSNCSKCLNSSKANRKIDFSIIQTTEGQNGKGLLN